MEDVDLAREAVADSMKLVEARMSMIERIDKHPLSWPVATEYQKLKRARSDDSEDDKIFAAAEKKVKDERKAKNDEAKSKTQTKQRITFQSRQSFGGSGNVNRYLLQSASFCLLCWFRYATTMKRDS